MKECKDRDQTIAQIPHEILVNHIFIYLEGLELFLMTRKVCFTWNELITKHDIIQSLNIKSSGSSETHEKGSERGITLVAHLSRNLKKCESFYQCANSGLFSNVSTLVLSGLYIGIVRPKTEMISSTFVPSYPGKTIVSRGYIKTRNATMVGSEDEFEGGSVLKFMPKLKHLNLSGDNIGDERNNWVQDVTSQQIQYLDLSGNDFGLMTCQHLTHSIELRHVQYLNLNNNSITEACCTCLAKASFKSLKVLKLANNQVTNAGLYTLCESSSIVDTLEHLDISSNEITDVACHELASGRFQMKHLTLFHMRHNDAITPTTKTMLLQHRQHISPKLSEENFKL
ncbi:hypothetical protein C9374_000048 [Naegleria lovaniensis]|uniref:F-box domain-containing protein n=1 Tax=Naegleria lovaniensis TaxID=51637 RepID=A0AA88GZP4_NAELO|nr:uncharacterized protein C9374_000048 [Naegleria lovaniensis]KAG2388609.1 hypothetical protein C9374_000048 [Naegleria lovaniensis]